MLERAKRWVACDPDDETCKELQTLIDGGDEAALVERFSGPLEFGTAGLRGVVGAGESRMNLAVVCIATAAVCDVLEREVKDAKQKGIVIGNDARTGSIPFARAAAEICAARGFRTWLFEELAPTPLVAFAARDLGTAAAVVVTASHNPPEYNGYKVYWDNGAQIVPPIDALVRDATLPRAAEGARAILHAARAANPQVLPAPASLAERYVEAANALRQQPELSLADVRVAYTPMHGVGGSLLSRLFARAGVKHFAKVESQWEPDGRFPTVRFPNPEEPGAMDRLLALAKETRAHLALANDPDADRLAAAIPSGDGYRALSGNEVGTLLGAYLIDRHRGPERALTAASVVSSPELGALAKKKGADHLETLTGFKWIANAAMAREKAGGVRFLFGYEEALGYTIGTLVRDKDGISAALLMVELVAWLAANGRTVDDYQRELAKIGGVWSSIQKSIVLSGDVKSAVAAMMTPLRANPPKSIGGLPVTRVKDYMQPDGALPASDMLLFELGETARMLIRPSGTEPKVKIYCDLRSDYRDDVAAVRSEGLARARALVESLALGS